MYVNFYWDNAQSVAYNMANAVNAFFTALNSTVDSIESSQSDMAMHLSRLATGMDTQPLVDALARHAQALENHANASGSAAEIATSLHNIDKQLVGSGFVEAINTLNAHLDQLTTVAQSSLERSMRLEAVEVLRAENAKQSAELNKLRTEIHTLKERLNGEDQNDGEDNRDDVYFYWSTISQY